MPCIATAARCRRASSFSTGFRRRSPRRRGSASRCRASVGGAVERNRIKRQLREVWSARLERVPAGNDYVLIVRPGLPDAVAANGFDWLGERVDEVLAMTKAAA